MVLKKKYMELGSSLFEQSKKKVTATASIDSASPVCVVVAVIVTTSYGHAIGRTEGESGCLDTSIDCVNKIQERVFDLDETRASGNMGSSVSTEVLERRNVVIIGGGYGGVQLACRLKTLGIPFYIIDPKEYFHHCVGALRGVVEPSTVSIF